MQATELFRLWQELLLPCADAFTYPGFQRFQEWLTGLVLNVEEHTITQSLVGLGRTQDCKALESFADTATGTRTPSNVPPPNCSTPPPAGSGTATASGPP